jgi:hypothetical protein
MTIAYPLDVPLEEFSEVTVDRININALQIATFTGKEKVQQFEGDWWVVSLSYRNLPENLGRRVSAFGSALRGSAGTFVVKFPGYVDSLGAASTTPSSPLVNGAGQAGNRVLNIKSAPADLTDWLRSGDILQVGPDTRPHWHEVLSDVDVAGDGTAAIDVWPAIRSGTINNDPIVTLYPKGLCRLTERFEVSITRPALYSLTFNARESTS